MTRRGVALMMALLILAGMMMLGLPFLYSQSVSRAGAASAAARQAAQVYSASSIALAAATAVYSQVDYRAGTTDFTHLGSLTTALAALDGTTLPTGPGTVPGVLTDPATGGVVLEARGLAPVGTNLLDWNRPGSRVLVRTSLGDESGKLDGNTLGPLGWKQVLQVAGIGDKDIGRTANDINDFFDTKHPSMWVQDALGNWAARFNDLSDAGQLADALVLHRIRHGPYRQLDDLLAVDPRQPAISWYRDLQPLGYPLYRSGLTPAELERLRPLVSFHTPGPGRQGLIDLGNQIGDDGGDGTAIGPQRVYLDSILDDMRAADQVITTDTNSGLVAQTGTDLTLHSVGSTGGFPTGTPFAFWAPAPLNINQASAAVLEALVGGTTPAAPITRPITSLTALAPDWIPWTTQRLAGTAPRYHAPVDVVSLGITRIDSQVAVLDAQGRVMAQERRRLVMQTLPQTTAMDLAWPTQRHLERLTDQGAANGCVTWPEATQRVPSLAGSTATSGASWDAVGIAPRPLRTLADTPAGAKIAWLANQEVAGLPLKGISPFNAFLAPLPDLANLRPDGLLVRPGDTVEINLNQWNPFSGTPDQVRMLEFWCAPAESVRGTTILLQGRNPALSDRREALEIAYDPALECLLVRRWSGAAPAPSSLAKRGRDDPTTPELDETSGSTLTVDLVPPLPASPHDLVPDRNETLLAVWIGPWSTNRWHRLQLLLGQGLPGGMSLLVDGLAGRDLTTQATAPTALVRGDHAYLPALALQGNLRSVSANDVENLQPPRSTSVIGLLSGFWNALPTAPTIAPGDLFPVMDGVLRLGDEYLRYESTTATATQVTFQRIWRGQRQNTQVGSSEPLITWPMTQEHLAGTRIEPGGFHLPKEYLNSAISTLLPGWTTTTTTLPAGPGNGVWETVTLPAIDPSVSVPLSGSFTWPLDGVVHLLGGVYSGYWYFESNGSALTLSALDPAGLTPTTLSSPTYAPVNPITVTARLCSLGVTTHTGFVTPASTASDPLVQVCTGDQAKLEWLTYSHIHTQAGRAYLVQESGWWAGTRGQQRTGRSDWIIGDQVVPVHRFQSGPNTGLTHGHWFLPGDTISLIPTSGTPEDVVIRQVSIDGYATTSDAVNDTINGWFTFDRAVITPRPVKDVDWTVGSGTSARIDLSPMGAVDLPQVPPIRPGSWKPSSATDPTVSMLPGAPDTWYIDALATVGLPGHATNLEGDQAAGILAILAPTTRQLANDMAADMTDGQILVATGTCWDAGSELGLLRMGTEVLAYQRVDLTFDLEAPAISSGLNDLRNQVLGLTSIPHRLLRVIGRGLVGTTPVAHTFSTLATPYDQLRVRYVSPTYQQDVPRWKPIPATRLPLGPVRQLLNHGGSSGVDGALARISADPATPSPTSGATSSTAWYQITEAPTAGTPWRGAANDPPATLLVDVGTAGPTYHGLYPKGPNQRSPSPLVPSSTNPDQDAWISPPWLRSLWGTNDVPTTTDRTPLLIGCYPRYPSAFPSGVTQQHLRSRAYAWAGFPARFARMQVDGLDDPTKFTSPSDPTFLVTWRAMAGAINTVDTLPGALRGGAGFSDWTQIACQLPSTVFANKDLDGIELRASWSYKNPATTLTALTDHQMTRPPLVMPPALPLRAPLVVLATEAR